MGEIDDFSAIVIRRESVHCLQEEKTKKLIFTLSYLCNQSEEREREREIEIHQSLTHTKGINY